MGSQIKYLDYVRRMHGHSTLASLQNAMQQIVVELVDCDIVSYSQFDGLVGREVTIVNLADADVVLQKLSPIFERLGSTHPLIELAAREPSPPTAKISDYASDVTFRNTALFVDYFRPARIDHQIAIPLRTNANFVSGITLCRTQTDFTRRDCEILEQLRPHMAEAYRQVALIEFLSNASTAVEQKWEEKSTFVLRATFCGQIRRMSAQLQSVFARCFSEPVGSELPTSIRQWIIRTLSSKLSPLENNPESSFTCWTKTGAIVLHIAMVEYHLQEIVLFVTENFHTQFCYTRLQRNGLTKREAEVLYWLSQGKTDHQIASQLGIGWGTVRTHVERIRSKLDVHTRASAAAVAVRWLVE